MRETRYTEPNRADREGLRWCKVLGHEKCCMKTIGIRVEDRNSMHFCGPYKFNKSFCIANPDHATSRLRCSRTLPGLRLDILMFPILVQIT